MGQRHTIDGEPVDPRIRLSLNILSNPDCLRAKQRMWHAADERAKWESERRKRGVRYPRVSNVPGAFGRDKCRMFNEARR